MVGDFGLVLGAYESVPQSKLRGDALAMMSHNVGQSGDYRANETIISRYHSNCLHLRAVAIMLHHSNRLRDRKPCQCIQLVSLPNTRLHGESDWYQNPRSNQPEQGDGLCSARA